MSATAASGGRAVSPGIDSARTGGLAWGKRRPIRIRKYLAIGLPAGVLALIVLATIFAPLLAPYDPNHLNIKMALQSPSWAHPLGTDQLGRDQLSRLLYGGRSTLAISGIAMAITVFIGVTVGLITGYFGGKLDFAISSFLTMLLALPSLLLTLAILGVMGPGTKSLLVALIGAGWVGHARIIRSAIMSLREQVYVEAAESMGATSFRILTRHLLPNLLTTVIILATLDIGALILTITSLSFLGLGVQPPTPDWGTMLNDARPYFTSVPLLVIIPGITIAVVVLMGNLLGDGLRDLADRGNRNR